MSFDSVIFGKSSSLFACCSHKVLSGVSVIKQTLSSCQINLESVLLCDQKLHKRNPWKWYIAQAYNEEFFSSPLDSSVCVSTPVDETTLANVSLIFLPFPVTVRWVLWKCTRLTQPLNHSFKCTAFASVMNSPFWTWSWRCFTWNIGLWLNSCH